MMLGTPISIEALPPIFAQVFAPVKVDVYTSDSKFGERTRKFLSALECNEHLKAQINAGSNFVGFAVHYPGTHGHLQDCRVRLDPEKCDGHSFRYSIGAGAC